MKFSIQDSIIPSLYRGKTQKRLLIVSMAIFCCTMVTVLNVLDRNHEFMGSFKLVGQSNFSNLDHSVGRVKRLPRAIIIGSRKSGTRALLRFLELNSAIKAAHNEVHYFDNEQNYARGLDWYRLQMPPTTADEVAIEKSPAYFVTNGVPERIKAMNSSIKLVLVMRNPVTRLVSDFSQVFANRLLRSVPTLMFENQLDTNDEYSNKANNYLDENYYTKHFSADATREFEDYVLRPDGGIANQRRAIRIGMYSNYIEKWLACFSREQIHFVDGEQLISNPYQVVAKVEKFLNLKPLIHPKQFVYNPRKGFYCIVTNITFDTGNYHEDSDGIKLSISSKPSNDRGNLNQKLICLSKSKGRRHVNVSGKLLNQLNDFYAPYNDYLYSLTGINFNTASDQGSQ